MQSYMYEQLGWFQYAVFPRQIMLQQTTVGMWFFSYTVWGLYSKSVIESMIAELNNACIYSFVEHCQILPYCAILHTTSNVLKCLLTALQTQYVNTVCFDFSSMTGKKDVNVVLICIYPMTSNVKHLCCGCHLLWWEYSLFFLVNFTLLIKFLT